MRQAETQGDFGQRAGYALQVCPERGHVLNHLLLAVASEVKRAKFISFKFRILRYSSGEASLIERDSC